MKPQGTSPTPGVWASRVADAELSEQQVRQALAEGLEQADLAGRRVLLIVPDGTRTAPVALVFRLLRELLGDRVKALDVLVALGTHSVMNDAALSRLVGQPVRDGQVDKCRILNHRWDRPDAFVALGTVSAAQVLAISEGRLNLEVPVRINRAVLDYDRLIVCGPVFPHEVVGFSGGNKYFFPGISGPDMIHLTHWLGALMTSMAIIGVPHTPVRRLIDLAAGMIPTPRMCLAMVMEGHALRGLFVGEMQGAWGAAAELSAKVNVVHVERPFQRVLAVMPEMYDDLWTGAKGMYKVEPAVADGGEVVIYAPHITEISYTHGHLIDQVGYHVRDYFLAQWDKFKDVPWGILAHSTHLRGSGTFREGVERPRIRVVLATGIPRQRCEQVALEYMDPATIDLAQWEGREDEGIKVIHRAGEVLYRANPELLCGASGVQV